MCGEYWMREVSPLSKTSANVAQLLSEAIELSQRAARLASEGRFNDAFDLEKQADVLRKQARRAAKRGKISHGSPGALSEKTEAEPERAQSIRAVAISAVNEIGVPISPRAVSEYAWARFGTKIDHRALPSLRRDEWRAWSSPRTARAVYLVPALDGNRFFAVRGKVTLSDWILDRRIIGPWSERTDHLNATIQLSRQLEWLSRVEPSSADRLRSLVAIYAATVRGAVFSHEPLDPKKVEEAANAELDVIGRQDTEWRAEAAKRARGFLNEEQTLWGAPPPYVIQRSKAARA
jgi:hypothetical protein